MKWENTVSISPSGTKINKRNNTMLCPDCKAELNKETSHVDEDYDEVNFYCTICDFSTSSYVSRGYNNE